MLPGDDRNINIYQSTSPAKYATHARRERAPDRNHIHKGRRSCGIVDSDLQRKTGQVGGQNSKPLSKQRSKHKHGHKGESSAPITLDESESSSLEKLVDSSGKHSSVHRRRHKSFLRDSPYSAHMVGKVYQRHRLKSCDRSSAKTAKSLSEVKEEFRRQSRASKLTDIEISMKQKQRITSHLSNAKKDVHVAPVASKPTSDKRWKCVMVRHSKKSTPMWVGDVPAEYWEEDCRNANNLDKHVKINKKKTVSGTSIANKKDNITIFDARKKTEAVALKNDQFSIAVHITDKRIHKRPLKSFKDREEAVAENVNPYKRCQVITDVKQNKKRNTKRHTMQVEGLSGKLTEDSSRKRFSDEKKKQAKVFEKIKLLEKTYQKDKVHEKDTSKVRYIKGTYSPADVHYNEQLQNSYGRIKKQKKVKKCTAVMNNLATNKNSTTGENMDKGKQSICKEKHGIGGQFNQGSNERHIAKEDACHRNVRETVHKDKKAKMKKTDKYDFLNTKTKRNREEPEETGDLRDIDIRTSNKNTNSSRAESLKPYIPSAGREVSSKCVNSKSDHILIKTISKRSTVNSPVSHASTALVADSRTSTPTSKRSHASAHSFRTPRSVTSASTEISADRHSNKNSRVPILRTGSTKPSSPEQFEKVTPVIGRPPTSRSAIPVKKTSSKTVTPIPVRRNSSKIVNPISIRPASTKESVAMSERLVTTKSVASTKGLYGYRTPNTWLTRSSPTKSTNVPASGRTSSKKCFLTPRKQTFEKSASDCGRPLSVRSENYLYKSRIPVQIKSASYAAGKTTTKSAPPSLCKPGAVKPKTPVSRRIRSSKSVLQMPRKVSVATQDSARPLSCKNNAVLCNRPVSRNDSSDPAKHNSSLPVPTRSANSCSKRTILSASKSLCTSSGSSLSSADHASGKSYALPNRLSISQASRRSVNVSMYKYDDDFEYESDESSHSESLSQDSYGNY